MIKNQRSYYLTVDSKQGQVIIDFSKSAFTLEFDIKRSNLASTNTAQIKVYNLAETTRRKIAKDDHRYDLYVRCQLKAGYGLNLPTIFKGNISHSWSVREGVNYISTMEAFDGGDALINGVTDQSYESGTPVEQVLRSTISDMPNVEVGVIGRQYTGSLQRGNTYSGNSADILKTLTNGGFFIDSEKVYLLGNNECVKGNLTVINSSSGLLNTPIRSNQMIHFDILFEPRIQMCQIILLQSDTDKNFNGLYKVVSISHRGIISNSVSGTAVTSLGLWQGPSGGSALEVVG